MTAWSSIQLSGPWTAEDAERHVRDRVIPVRLACMTPSAYPLTISLWYIWEEGALWCAVQETSRIANYFRSYPRCGFEIAADDPPYHGVRGVADVALVPEAGERILRRLIARYLGSEASDLAHWLLSRADTEIALQIQPRRAFTWDYGARMRNALASGASGNQADIPSA